MVTITCDDCGGDVSGEPHKGIHGPATITIYMTCECGTEWRALTDGTKWRPPPMVEPKG